MKRSMLYLLLAALLGISATSIAVTQLVTNPTDVFVPPGVTYVAPTAAMPAPGYKWVYGPHGWRWYHPQYGWYRAPSAVHPVYNTHRVYQSYPKRSPNKLQSTQH